jgi:hypothetical protein
MTGEEKNLQKKGASGTDAKKEGSGKDGDKKDDYKGAPLSE